MQIPQHLVRTIGYFLGPTLFVFILCLSLPSLTEAGQSVLAVAAWMVCWWMTEVVALPVTALIPLVVFPLIGVMDVRAVAANYAHPIVFLFLGGFILALGIEKVQLHKRLALLIIRRTGTSPDRIVLGFMLATALLSMWISNTATTLVMLPIAGSVIHLLIDDTDGFTAADKRFALSLFLGIAFAANIGGTATLIGTPPNTVLVGIMKQDYDIDLTFLRWMMLGLPFAALMLLICYWVVVKWMYRSGLDHFQSTDELLNAELEKLGPVDRPERMVLAVFGFVAFLWITRVYVNQLIPGLNLTDPGISMLGALILFSLPVHLRQGRFLLHWKDTKRLPWGILILFGGGLALASGMAQSGIVDLIGEWITAYRDYGFLIVALSVFVVLFLTELMSNVALINVFIPVLAGVALGLEVPILHLAIPATLASSCAFMLPMATPPNAIVFASGHIKVYEMARAGIFLNLIAALLLIGLAYTLVPVLF